MEIDLRPLLRGLKKRIDIARGKRPPDDDLIFQNVKDRGRKAIRLYTDKKTGEWYTSLPRPGGRELVEGREPFDKAEEN